MSHESIRTTGAVVTIYWSRLGRFGDRKQRWGARATSSWDAVKLHGDTWYLPRSVSHEQVKALFDEILRPSDKAIVVFPHGSATGGASQMSVHTYNCRRTRSDQPPNPPPSPNPPPGPDPALSGGQAPPLQVESTS